MNKYQEAHGCLWSVFKYEPIEMIDEERKENLKYLDTLKELVKKATPMKKVVRPLEGLYDVHLCPVCHTLAGDNDKYCANCGQRIDGLE